ncbi:MAG TPA: hypothetical protein VEZ72_24140 [Paenibacillus sp.]|nr:hypothetical protein [Paenibacillus sp.]
MKAFGRKAGVWAMAVLLGAAISPGGSASALEGFPAFENQATIVNPADLDYNPTGEYIFPTIVNASEHVANPLGTYYLYAAPHDNPGGIALFYSNSLDGPWTEYAGNPIVANNWLPHYGNVGHVSSPHVMWNSVAGKFYMYFHGDNATTRVASSADGVNWTYEDIVITTADFTGLSETSYARVFEYTIPSKNNKYIMLLMGNNGGTRKIYLAWSNDGLNWTTQHTPLLSPVTGEGGNLSGPHYFPWNGKHYVAYHSGSGDIHIAEVGSEFNTAVRTGVLYNSTSGAPDDGRAAAPAFYTSGDTMYMFYEQGGRLDAKIAYAKASITGGNASEWNIIDDGLSNYTAGWSSTGTTGQITQHNSYITINDSSTSGYRYLTKNGFVAPSGPFTFEFRGKSLTAGATNEVTVRSGAYQISLFLTHGTSGSAQNKATSPTKSVAVDTTTAHVYRVVVHANYTYDLYIDGVLKWSGAASSGSGTSVFKIGGDTPYTADFDLDYVKMGEGEILP